MGVAQLRYSLRTLRQGALARIGAARHSRALMPDDVLGNMKRNDSALHHSNECGPDRVEDLARVGVALGLSSQFERADAGVGPPRWFGDRLWV